MYTRSSQRTYWTFNTEQDIAELRRKHNHLYIEKQNAILNIDVNINLNAVFNLGFKLIFNFLL